MLSDCSSGQASINWRAQQLFLLCPRVRVDVAQPAIFWMELRTPSGERQVEFSVVSSPGGIAEITITNGTRGRVRLPGDPSLQEHPELFGVLFAFGLLKGQDADYTVTR